MLRVISRWTLVGMILVVVANIAWAACTTGCAEIDGWTTSTSTTCYAYDVPMCKHNGDPLVTNPVAGTTCKDIPGLMKDTLYFQCDAEACTNLCPGPAPGPREVSANQDHASCMPLGFHIRRGCQGAGY